ncbi:dienelactone hydrolase family protein [Spongiimicrobium salis]|uniref:dienelactone hydrolase family protein n=1 Tax=Spongiimicrobium salis TaxID=1667022 RepID=UPI00374DBADA
MPTPITAYQKERFSATIAQGTKVTHDIYTRGNFKKIVVIMQEMPGIDQKALALADRFSAEQYTVVFPHLFGPLGKTAVLGNFFKVLCMQKEFRMFAAQKSSPIVDYLAALCTHIKEKHQVKGVAVIGMCLTGNFAISLMANDAVLAGFASQPSMPLLGKSSIHMSPDEISAIKKKLDTDGPMHCGRFEKDFFCKAERFHTLETTFNTDGKQRIIFHELPGKGHSILTHHFVDEEGHPTKKAFSEVLQYFDEALS